VKIRPVVSELIQALRGTDGQTNMTKLIGVFFDNANAPETEYVECQFIRFFFLWACNMDKTRVTVACLSWKILMGKWTDLAG